jgi:hypothetical protein
MFPIKICLIYIIKFQTIAIVPVCYVPFCIVALTETHVTSIFTSIGWGEIFCVLMTASQL